VVIRLGPAEKVRPLPNMYCHAVIVVGVGVQPEMPVERTYVSTMVRKVDDVLSVNESVML